jgi:hypothetical protein
MSRNSYIPLFPYAEWTAPTGQNHQCDPIEMQNIDTSDTVETRDPTTQKSDGRVRLVQSRSNSKIGGYHESDYVRLHFLWQHYWHYMY